MCVEVSTRPVHDYVIRSETSWHHQTMIKLLHLNYFELCIHLID